MKALVALALLALPAIASAQSAQLRLPKGPYFTGVPIEMEVVAEGFREEPPPEIRVDAPEGADLVALGVSPNVQTSITVINGRVSQEKRTEFAYRYRMTASEPGTVRIGPFTLVQGGVERSTRSADLHFDAIPESDRVELRLHLPDGPIYPGERVPVSIEWSFDTELEERLHGYALRVPLFERTDAFRFIDEEAERGAQELTIQTEGGEIELPAATSRRQKGDGSWFVVTAERVMVPLEAGRFELPPARIVVDEITSFRGRSLFGGRVIGSTRKLQAEDLARTLVVRDVPLAGRPASFAGAVGSGFSLEVSAERSVVRVGDPIELELVLRGDGNLDGAGLPDLLAGAGLPAEHFSTSAGGEGGVVEEGAKTFRAVVRVLDESVREIPALEYAWFDPEAGEFRTTRSRPIALSVGKASVVTARDVVTGAPSTAERSAEREETASEPTAMTERITRTGANLSIVREPELLLRSATRGASGLGLELSLYGASLAVVALSWVVRRRADVDPRVLERRRTLRRERGRIVAAGAAARREGVETIADALRAMLRASAAPRPGGLDELIAECEAIVYAPGSEADAGQVDPSLHERALALADALMAEPT